jgi:hypothetical protein
MAKKPREKLGPFVVTTRADLDDRELLCAMCGKKLAALLDEGLPESAAYELFRAGRVPVPNFGWFCDQMCASDYERAYNVPFQRDADGNVNYYSDGWH